MLTEEALGGPGADTRGRDAFVLVFYAFNKQTRKKYFNGYLDSLKGTVADGDTTDFLGNETFQSYSHARNGYSLRDVLKVPAVVKKAVSGVISEMVTGEETDACTPPSRRDAVLEEILDQAKTLRAQSFTQTRDEVIKFYHDLPGGNRPVPQQPRCDLGPSAR